MRLAFVVQRYGTEVLEGAEYQCRLIAERMSARHSVEVLTTCARDAASWKNEYPEGSDRVRGVTVKRFANAATRNPLVFARNSNWLFNHRHTPDDEREWLKQQGPWCPALIDYLQRRHRDYEALIFFDYRHATTVLGIQVVPDRSILVPDAREELALGLDIYKKVFELPAGLACNSDNERTLLESRFRMRARSRETVGCGVDLPQHRAPRVKPEGVTRDEESKPRPATTAVSEDAMDAEVAGGDESRESSAPERFGSHLGARGAMFRRRHRMYGPMALYAGRVERGEGCEEVIQYFADYARSGGEACLALMGPKLMPLPEDPFVNFAGILAERERTQALEAATVALAPSPTDTLGILALEAFSVGTPVLANARNEEVVEHCIKSNGGLWYADKYEFVECLEMLIRDEGLRAAMGRSGRDYVRRNYRWDVVLAKYERMIGKIRS